MKKKGRRAILFSVIAGVVSAALIIIFISPLCKYLVEKYDEEYTGRQVKMDWAYVNPFTGYAYFSNLRIYESDNYPNLTSSDTVFFSCGGVELNISLLKLFSKTYEISSLSLTDPKAWIIQGKNKHDFNFNDLLEKFDPPDKDTTKPPLHFNLLDLKVSGGEFHYREDVIPIKYFIKKVEFESDGLRWDVDTVSGKYSFTAGMGSGDIKGDFMFNRATFNYRLTSLVHQLDMTLIGQYLRDLSNYGTVRAFFNANIRAKGNMNDAQQLDAIGKLAISDFHFGKDRGKDYASFDRMFIDIDRLNPAGKLYLYDSVLLIHPAFTYEKYDHLDNIQLMFGKEGALVKEARADTLHFNLILEIADYVKKVVKNFFHSYYKINRAEIRQGDMRFSDYSLNEKFTVAANPLDVVADSVDKNRKTVKMQVRSGIDPYGYATFKLSVNPRDSSDFDLDYHIQKMPVTVFNPYFLTYTSFPMDRGTVEFSGRWKVRNGSIKSTNRILVIDPRVARRVRKKDNKWIPLPLVMALVRERANVIDYEIPISGNLKDPRFHLKDVFLDLLANIFIKPPTIPYGVKVKEVEKEIEKSLVFKWEFRQSGLRAGQENFLFKVAEFLEGNPEAMISVHPLQYTPKEQEYILLFEARKKYFLSQHARNAASFTKEDSQRVANMPVKDPGFVKYLDKQGGKYMFTIQEKCSKVLGQGRVDDQLAKLAEKRKANFLAVFKESGTLDRVKMYPVKNTFPYNGFSVFKIDYSGDWPADLVKAYEELDELDEKYPRKRYSRERKKLRNIFSAVK